MSQIHRIKKVGALTRRFRRSIFSGTEELLLVQILSIFYIHKNIKH